MPRIPPEEIERLKQEMPVQRLAEARGIKLSPHGKDLIGLCPFHDDHDPSLVITPSKNLWNCLGACGSGGTVIDWVMKSEGVSFRHAVEMLREGAIFKGTTAVKPVKVATVPKLPPPVDFNAEDQELLQQTVKYYHQTLKQSPEALSYLEKRGLKNSEMIDRFKIGYANRTLGLRLPDKNRKAGAEIRERLTKTGIYRETGHEHFNGSVVFPIFDENAQVTEIYGRKILDNLRTGTAYHLYLPGPHKGVFNFHALKTSKEIILCEAIIDALTFWCAGFHNVTASYGVNGFTPDHLAALKEHGVEKIFIAYDRDTAGDKAAEELSRQLIEEGFECFRILFPRDMDANEYALKEKCPGKSLDLLVRKAVWLGRGKRQINASEVLKTPIVSEGEQKAYVSRVEIESTVEKKITEMSPTPKISSQASVQTETTSTTAKEGISALPLAAKYTPQPSPLPLVFTVTDAEIIISIIDRRWRIRGLAKNMSYDQLKVNIHVSQGERFHLDTFDLYSARCRVVFVKQACEELRLKEEVIKLDLGKVLLKLEELQDQQIKSALEPKEKEVSLTPEERKEALEVLQSPNILERVLADFEKCGVVGEETNKLVGYLAAVSRKLENPLAVIIQSSSAAGKTSLMEAVIAFMPEEERVKYSAMTGQSLFYMGETNLKHKILAIVEEEGAERASYALKLLQSEGELTIASTGKDPSTGRLVTNEYHVEGPVMIFITTTNADIDEELQNRCIMLSVDESREQTRAIHWIQREKRTLAGLRAKNGKDTVLKLHRNVQRLLKPLRIINHYAHNLTFLDDKTRLRRDHDKYLNLIETITLIHQHQRTIKTDVENGKQTPYLEVTLEDIELANKLADEVLGRTLDEMPPQTRKLLLLIEQMVLENCQKLTLERFEYYFTRRDVREYCGWGNTQLKLHLQRLEEYEYLIPHRGGRGQNYVYELIYDGKGKDGKPFISGLLDVEKLRGKFSYDSEKSALNIEKSGASRPHVGLKSGPSRVGKILGNKELNILSEENQKISQNFTYMDMGDKFASYPVINHSLAAKEAMRGLL
ncbi:MAG: toprim domain-containing protein [Candidatus Riflebacteria bacterium]|nr:toprim domain-containing protein [Candidatus Riflebacteria bacterium]